ncbi:MAG: hypothetical protein E7589_02120 [Ruminococcaceae bacterium]|nr:hypothetical protein [Oscillospiraceae bacterium]
MQEKNHSVEEIEPMRAIGMCPYFQRERGNGLVYCECAKFRFPDKISRREIVYRFCAHPENYKACVIKQTMDHFYERKYNQIEGGQREVSNG